jgi:hypothetical protein
MLIMMIMMMMMMIMITMVWYLINHPMVVVGLFQGLQLFQVLIDHSNPRNNDEDNYYNVGDRYIL